AWSPPRALDGQPGLLAGMPRWRRARRRDDSLRKRARSERRTEVGLVVEIVYTWKQEFGNYHLKLEFKGGKKKWRPREEQVRDSGVLYRCVGRHGAAGTFWMRSQECQIQEHDCGDYWSVAGAIVDVEGERKGDKGSLVYKKGGKKYTVPSREAGGQ